jgi:hypothetical protein
MQETTGGEIEVGLGELTQGNVLSSAFNIVFNIQTQTGWIIIC